MIETERLIIMSLNRKLYKALKKNKHKSIIATNWPNPLIDDIISYNLKLYRKYETMMKWSVWIIVLKDEQRIIGDIGFKSIPDHEGKVDIGYSILTDFRCKGYAKESLTYMVKHAFEDDQVTCVLADCLKENHASKAVLNGCGFIQFNEDETSLYWKTEKESLR
jgi:ribosomal-protein-alanine N-acetyltransferase